MWLLLLSFYNDKLAELCGKGSTNFRPAPKSWKHTHGSKNSGLYLKKPKSPEQVCPTTQVPTQVPSHSHRTTRPCESCSGASAGVPTKSQTKKFPQIWDDDDDDDDEVVTAAGSPAIGGADCPTTTVRALEWNGDEVRTGWQRRSSTFRAGQVCRLRSPWERGVHLWWASNGSRTDRPLSSSTPSQVSGQSGGCRLRSDVVKAAPSMFTSKHQWKLKT